MKSPVAYAISRIISGLLVTLALVVFVASALSTTSWSARALFAGLIIYIGTIVVLLRGMHRHGG